MLLDFIREMLVELLSTLVIERLVERVRFKIEVAKEWRRARRRHQRARLLHIRNRERLLHRLFTETPADM